MNNAVQIIVTPSGEWLTALPEEDYLLLLAASEDDEGEPKPEFLEGCADAARRSSMAARLSRWTFCEGPRPPVCAYLRLSSSRRSAKTSGAKSGTIRSAPAKSRVSR